ncbi:MAG: carboxypeptidase-like regulatory domain-containing protein, partial [Schaedlerella arabinosiphila]|nr:carboxypeptidase-like regulatory domain-containing protein [Schaedlerella arabinosiphila]
MQILLREERSMKRIISCLLAVILVFSLCVDTSAEPVDTETAGSGPDVVAEGDGETGTGENENLLQEDNEGTEDEEDSETEEGAGPENTDEPESGSEPSEKNLFTVNPDDASFGTEDEEGQEDGVEDEEEEKDEEDEKEKKRSQDRDYLGQVDVEILSALNLQKDVNFTVSLTGQESKQVMLAADQETENGGLSQGDATFEDLEPGTYVLTVGAPGFATYTQELAVEDWAYNLTLTTGIVSGFSYDQPGSVHPGLLLLGDVDGNGVIDDADRDLLVDAIDAGEREPEKQAASRHENANLNLNGDQWVDLADLEYFA